MKRVALISFILSFFIFSCVTKPPAPAPVVPAPVVDQVQPAAPAPAPQEAQPEAQPAEETPPLDDSFNPASITEAQLEATKADVNSLIDNLNKIIRAKDFNAWRGYLSDSYYTKISSQAFLDDTTEELYKRDQLVATNLGRDPKRVQKKILRTARDYFDNVVVPSRSNDHMDDLDYISENRVKAYTVDTRGNRLVLYDLELIDGKWKIIN